MVTSESVMKKHSQALLLFNDVGYDSQQQLSADLAKAKSNLFLKELRWSRSKDPAEKEERDRKAINDLLKHRIEKMLTLDF